MRKIPWLIAAGLMLAVLCTPSLAEETKTLTGEFLWSQRDTRGDLEAIFTPAGEGKWSVAFNFEFRGEPHTYTGTAEGSLSDGELKGEVQNENKKRTWVFNGSFEAGAFKGTHAEIRDGAQTDTGTLRLGG
jgi:hypothetical protein